MNLDLEILSNHEYRRPKKNNLWNGIDKHIYFLTAFSLPAWGPFLGRLEMTWITFQHAISIGKVGIPPW